MRRRPSSVLDSSSVHLRMLAATVLAAVACSNMAAQGPSARFAEMAKQHLPADDDATTAVVAGDIDGDGDLDLLVGNAGQDPPDPRQNRLYLNEGSGRFIDVTATRMPVDNDWTTSLALGDLDTDGDLDLVVGNGEGYRNRLYLNDGTGAFFDATSSRLPANTTSTRVLALGDVDADGDLDLVVGSQKLLYLNDGSARFTDVTAARMPVSRGAALSLALGDVDGDGDLDLVAGNFGQNQLFLNDGAGRFTDWTAAKMPTDGDSTNTVALGDVDGDGDLDLALGNSFVSNTGMSPQNRLYLNDGRGRFTDATLAKLPVDRDATQAIALGDVERDGDLDLITGNSGEDRLYLNDGTGGFTDATQHRLPVDSFHTSDLVLDDVDADGDLDLVRGNHGENRLFLNDGTGHFADAKRPRMPASSAFAQYPRSLALGDVDGDADLDVVIAFSGQNRLCLNDGNGQFTDATAVQLPILSEHAISLALGDVDGDGDLDIVVGNTGWAGSQNRLHLNDGSGRFTDVTAVQMPVDHDMTTSVALGDVDGDADLDLVVGNTFDWFATPPQPPQNRLYLNDGSGRFTDATAAQMPFDYSETQVIDLGDVDGDGDLDLVVGNAGRSRQDFLYVNDGSGGFTDATSSQMPVDTAETTSLALGDVDSDGDLDLAIGTTATRGYLGGQERLYLNDGAGRFVDATSTRMPRAVDLTRSLALDDVDCDGDLDLVVGNFDFYGQQNRLYQNDGSGLFTDVTATQMPIVRDSTLFLALGDVEGDGDRDLFVVNHPGNVALYVNLSRQLHAPYLLRLDDPWQLDVYARSGPPRLSDVAFPFISFAPAAIPLPPLGTLGIDPALAVALPVVVVPQPAAVGSVSVHVPNVPSLVGVPIYAQALLMQSPVPRLTNVVAEPILAR